MQDTPPNSYDEVRYPVHAVLQAHPERLAVIAKLMGMNPAPVESCRVMELGCGAGATTIALAHALPESSFLGIDSAAAPIAEARSFARELGLRNIEFLQADIADWKPVERHFDYIIAHGVFSWVPHEVQESIFTIIRAGLKPDGVAFVSYNAYPGWHRVRMVREMMLFHVRQIEDYVERVAQARGLIRFLADSQSEEDPYRALLQHELERLEPRSDEALIHDELNPANMPLYFHEFMRRAAGHGLQYLGEADFHEMHARRLPEKAQEKLAELEHDLHAKEQYLDFIKCRRFRQTLLCHQQVPLSRSPGRDCIMALHISAQIRSTNPEAEAKTTENAEFQAPGGARVTTNRPLAKAAFRRLEEAWPQALHFSDLLSDVRRALCKNPATERQGDAGELADILLAAYSAGAVTMHSCPPRPAAEVSPYPVASPIARLQARSGRKVTTLRLSMVQIADEITPHLLTLLDGTRNREQLVEEMSRFVEAAGAAAGKRVVEGGPSVRETVEAALEELRRMALLVR
ncbi:MAG: methyltransferase domain-containing protein [Acidobacteria bacterium]|nr:methyltransferase domain-containing protein [Acidobacteriota bacterium]